MMSYGVSSDITFTCPPCSVRIRPNADHPAKRLTYCSIRDLKSCIQCFTDTSGERLPLNRQVSISTYQLPKSAGPVISLEIVPGKNHSTGETSITVVAVHENGEIRCLSENLSEEYYSLAPKDISGGSLDGMVKCAAVIDGDQAREGLLKNREDITTVLQGSNLNSATSLPVAHLLVLLISVPSALEPENDKQNICLKTYRLDKETYLEGSQISRRIKRPEELLSLPLPYHTKRDDTSTYYFHKQTGALYLQSGKVLEIIDLTRSIPHVQKRIEMETTLRSFLYFSPTAVVVSYSDSISIIDTRFNSVRAIGSSELPKDDSKNHEHGRETTLLSYISSPQMIVAIQGRTLLVFQITAIDASGGTNRKRRRSGTLVDAIMCGVGASRTESGGKTPKASIPHQLGEMFSQNEVDENWETTKSKLDQLALENDVDGFDTILTPILSRKSADSQIPKKERFRGQTTKSINSMVAVSLKVDYILSKIFMVNDSPRSPDTISDLLPALEISLLPAWTFQWLVRNKCLSVQQIECALKRRKSLLLNTRLRDNAMIEALAAHDTSLKTLLFVLQEPIFLTPCEIACAVHHIIVARQQSEILAKAKLITQTEADNSLQIVNVCAQDDMISPSGNAKTENQADLAMRQCLTRLFHCHDGDIRKALKQELSQPDLLSFVDYLRMELARGGWLSRYVDGSIPSNGEHSEQAGYVSIVAKLLNCAVDSLGIGGWILGSSSASSMMDRAHTIGYLKAEISAALEGIEEAAYLQGTLNEVLLYSKTAIGKRRTLTGEKSNKPGNTNKPITFSGEKKGDQALPIGLKALDQEVELTRIAAGGELKTRSMRDVGQLKSRKVGPYSFDKILV